ncbi:MAG: secondary thiamine-phosphate synthase enzyme YjbQ [Bryobacterales bacterium]|jgi:secondary thiamine-phosphate synthase enzyme|nr:secondary thiamine-phosphate synthase enzyme YjbQ [Bryobacterales bacterium]
MIAHQSSFRLSTQGNTDIIDITHLVEQIVRESGVQFGITNVSCKGSTLGITTLEYEPGAVSDLRRVLDQIAPPNQFYAHNARWGDENGYAHIRSALMGTVKVFPVSDGSLRLGTWQQIVLCDFDDRPRDREVTVTTLGELA